jgi:hypothetical protein
VFFPKIASTEYAVVSSAGMLVVAPVTDPVPLMFCGVKYPWKMPSVPHRAHFALWAQEKLERVRILRCRSCGRCFTPGPRALLNKTYPVREIIDAITFYNRGYSLAQTSERIASRAHHVGPRRPCAASHKAASLSGVGRVIWETFRRIWIFGLC